MHSPEAGVRLAHVAGHVAPHFSVSASSCCACSSLVHAHQLQAVVYCRGWLAGSADVQGCGSCLHDAWLTDSEDATTACSRPRAA